MASSVDVLLKFANDSEGIHVTSIDEVIFRRQSIAARNQLNEIAAFNAEKIREAAAVSARRPVRGAGLREKEVYLVSSGTTREAVRFLLGRMARDGTKMKLSMGDRSFVFNVRIWAAAEAMELDPRPFHLLSNLKQYIARGDLGPAEVEAIVAVFEEGGAIWKQAVHHVGWWFVHKCPTQEKWNALVEECEKHPAFNEAVLDKMHQLKAMAARKVKREERFERTKEDNRYRKTSNRQNAQEGRQGLQVTSEETVDWIMGRKKK